MGQGANKRFQRADDLFAEKRYREALVLLDELDQEYPGKKNILFPRALCLAKVGDFRQAREIAERLVEEFGDARAQRLLERMAAAEKRKAARRSGSPDAQPDAPVQDYLQFPGGSTFGPPDRDILEAGGGFTVARPTPLQPSPHRTLYLILWSLVGLIAVVLGILAAVQRLGE